MDQLEQIMDRTQVALSSDNPSRSRLAMDLNKLPAITILQRAGAPPPGLQTHHQQYNQIMEVQTRMLEDIVMNQGEDLDFLAQKRDVIMRTIDSANQRELQDTKRIMD